MEDMKGEAKFKVITHH